MDDGVAYTAGRKCAACPVPAALTWCIGLDNRACCGAMRRAPSVARDMVLKASGAPYEVLPGVDSVRFAELQRQKPCGCPGSHIDPKPPDP